ncbi:MAG: molybdenum cofactor biosynthesis protein C [Elusimicrobia bacterium GWA2_56_46]|nr:MAG: molybdenum cofactor biosynthesis protein C [Elusimicrobia bacterium GWA2_56_46]OGR56138.1 MAG: molybdenum cofactor biosynthesis protein C [Elusimicrobia bacterium GWC2_56_31]HBW23089.1 cyclic pyranopterin monophosphate synthase MoaC [Elusimicrobiota bacterium]
MIDVGAKKDTRRIAKAQAYIKLNAEIVRLIKAGKTPKGNVLEAARFAGILAAKNTAGLLPLCHNLPLNFVGVGFDMDKTGVLVKTEARCTGKTGVEMEALVAASAAALTIYDMCKMFAQDLEISEVFLLEKSGGKSGVYRAVKRKK